MSELARRPEVGARCGKSARRALSGGRPERAVPTGTKDAEAQKGGEGEREFLNSRSPSDPFFVFLRLCVFAPLVRQASLTWLVNCEVLTM